MGVFYYTPAMKVLLLLAVIGAANCAPQFDFNALKDVFKSFGSSSEDDTYEKVPYKTINKTLEGNLAFEIREYPTVNWVCTDMTYDMPDGATEEDGDDESTGFFNSIRDMFSGGAWKKRPSSVMFKRLFRYISGVNEERQEIEMTIPVLSKITPNQETKMMKNRMCFYLDSAAQAAPPTPEEETVYVYNNKPLTVAVYEFGGYAMRDEVWAKIAQEFETKLGDRVNSLDTTSYFTAGYDSPMKLFNRKNEVMFEVNKERAFFEANFEVENWQNIFSIKDKISIKI